MKKLTTIEFIKKAKNVHGDRYDYSQTNYCCRRNLVDIICNKHGLFQQNAGNHLNGSGCPKCCEYDTKKLIMLARQKHGDKYDYSEVNYIDSKTKIKIICPEHGIFEQTPNSHLNGNGCPKCYVVINNIFDFIKKSNEIHQNKYDYSFCEYKTCHKKIKIICPEHGVFEQTPNSHLNGRGCPNCRISKGEQFIINWLKQNNISFEKQKTFNNCKRIKTLKFDFYLPDYNTLIEYDGQQHYIPIRYFGGEISFERQQLIDRIKTEFAEQNKIRLLRISHKEMSNISIILKNNFITY